jgi:cytochrome P450
MTTTIEQVPEHLVTDYDVFDPALCIPVDTMQERSSELAELGPVVYSTAHGGHWLVTRYEEVHQILHDPQTFSSYPNSIVNAGQGRLLPLELDPPDHTVFRNVLQPMFSPTRMKALEAEIRTIVTELIDGFIEQGECEFVRQFAHELPSRVFLAQMGLPLSDAPLFTDWTTKALVGKPGGTEEESNAVRGQVLQELGVYFAGVIATRKGEVLTEKSDVTSVIVNTPITLEGEDERHLTEDELQRLFLLVLIAGLHTTQGSLGWGMMHLSSHPEVRARLIADPSLIDDAVEEILRIEAAVAPGRRVTREIELGGVTLRENDQLLMLLCAANRDAEVFDDPDGITLERNPNKHLSFGGGRHRCIGSHLARVELRIGLEQIHRRLPDYELSAVPVFHSSQTRGVLAMPIRFTPGPRSTA